jgi:uridylate kinase
MSTSQTFVISLGGSMIVPDAVDTAFVRSFSDFIRSRVAVGEKFFIVCGGGRVARRYQDALTELGNTDHDSLDWVGIGATRLNAMLVKEYLKDISYENIVTDPTLPIDTEKSVVVGAGWKPGWSTDYVAIALAKNNSASRVINISNVDHVYTADPRTNPDAVKLDDVTWGDYRNIIPREWTPGMSSPFDPMAAALAEEGGIEVAILHGSLLSELANILEQKPFNGTLIY